MQKTSIVLISLVLGGCQLEMVQPANYDDDTGDDVTTGTIPFVEWHEGHGTDREEHVHEGLQTEDGGYLAIGHVFELESDFQDILVVKTDPKGVEEWQLVLGTSDAHDVGVAVLETPEGFLIGGGLHAGDNQKAALVMLDSNGSEVWSHVFDHTGAGAIRGLDLTIDGHIAATGYTDAEQGGFQFIAEGMGFLAKVGLTGAVRWESALALPQGTKVRALDDDTYAVLSTVYNDENEVHNAAILWADDQGETINTRNLGDQNNVQAFDFDVTDSDGFILTGHTNAYDTANWDCMAMELDSAGNALWTSTFGQPRGYDATYIHDECYGVRQVNEGNFIVVGGTGDEYDEYSDCAHESGCSDEWKSYVVKLDPTGDVLWEATYGEADHGHNAAEYVDQTEDGGVIVFTDTDSQGEAAPNNFGFLKLSTLP